MLEETAVETRQLHPLAFGAVSLQGPRPVNEDSLWSDPERGLFLVADGLGGPGKGDLASQMLLTLLESALRSKPLAPLDEVVQEALTLANRKIIAAFLGEPALKGLGTTVTLARIAGNRLKLWHVGDSRAYLLRGKLLSCLTEDHNLARVLAKMGQAPPENGAHTLVRCLGKDANCPFDTVEVSLEPGDRLLLCTDGVYRSWSDEDLARIAATDDLPAIAHELAQGALDRGTSDNASIIVLGWAGPPMESSGEPAAERVIAQAPSTAEFEERVRRLAVLLDLGTALSMVCGVEDTLKIVLQHCMGLAQATEGAIFEGGTQEWLAAVDANGQNVADFTFDPDLIARVHRGGEAELLVGGRAAAVMTTAVGFDLTTTLCVPIRSAGKRLGVVYLKANVLVTDMTERELDLVTELVAFGAPFIETGRRFSALQQTNAQLSQALSRVQHTLGDTSEARMHGNLAELRLEDVIAAHIQAKSSGWLRLKSQIGASGMLGLRDGSLVSCRTALALMPAEQALGEILSWEEGSFHFEPGDAKGDALPITHLYKAVEHAPRWRMAKARVPVHAAPVMLVERDIDDIPLEHWQIIQRLDGKATVRDVALASQIPLLNVMEALLALQASCTLYIPKP